LPRNRLFPQPVSPLPREVENLLKIIAIKLARREKLEAGPKGGGSRIGLDRLDEPSTRFNRRYNPRN
jgi:hypothetical protein